MFLNVIRKGKNIIQHVDALALRHILGHILDKQTGEIAQLVLDIAVLLLELPYLGRILRGGRVPEQILHKRKHMLFLIFEMMIHLFLVFFNESKFISFIILKLKILLGGTKSSFNLVNTCHK